MSSGSTGAERQPLTNRRIVITRPEHQAAALGERLRALGANVLYLPLIHIEPVTDFTELDAACRQLARFDWMIVTSANGAAVLLDRLSAAGNAARTTLAATRGPRLCAVGPATAARLEAGGLPVDVVPAEQRGEGVVRALHARGIGPGTQVLYVRGDRARDVVSTQLRALGATVTDIIAYRTLPITSEEVASGEAFDQLRAGTCDAIVFMSGSAVDSLVGAVRPVPLSEILGTTLVVCVGPITARAAAAAGLAVDLVARTPTTEGVAKRLAAHFSA